MINKTSKALVCANGDQANIFKNFLVTFGFEDIETFGTIDDAYEYATRHQCEFFVTALSLPDGPGVVLLQKLRACGNYGLETHMFVGDEVDNSEISLFYQYDIHYVLKLPFTEERFLTKMKFIEERESNLPPIDAVVRDVHAAIYTKVYDMAEFIIQQGQKDHGDHDKFDILMSEIHLEKGENEKAKVLLSGVLEKNPDSLWARSLLAKYLLATDNKEDAKVILDELAEGYPHHMNVLENAGVTNFDLGFVELAEKQVAALANIDHTNEHAFELGTKIKVIKGEVTDCLDDLKKTHSEKEIVSIMNSCGIELAKKGKRDEANRVYEETLSITENPEFQAKLHYNIGLNLVKMGQEKEACTHLEKALKAKPDFKKAKHLLDEHKKSAA
ncbi:MAG: tetratricopeptide repeat protein [Pseudobacteriovorax sp.]|nr:tetratricopeptide repeat protein [Pseudobacteriovorax sp.]